VRFGFFHADPHPATWRWPPNGGLIYYAFGMNGVRSPHGLRRTDWAHGWAGRSGPAMPRPWCGTARAAGVIAPGIDAGRCAVWWRVMLNDALTPPFSANVLEKLLRAALNLV